MHHYQGMLHFSCVAKSMAWSALLVPVKCSSKPMKKHIKLYRLMSNILKSIIIWNGEHTKASKLQRLHLTRLPSYCFNWSGSELILSLSAAHTHCFQGSNKKWIYYLVGIWMSHSHYNLLMSNFVVLQAYRFNEWKTSHILTWINSLPWSFFLEVCSVQSSSFSTY